MKTFQEIMKNLFKVKSLWSISAMFMCIYGTLSNTLPSEITSMIIGSIIAYYFNKKEEN